MNMDRRSFMSGVGALRAHRNWAGDSGGPPTSRLIAEAYDTASPDEKKMLGILEDIKADLERAQ